jgi:signal transduction histidine kinase
MRLADFIASNVDPIMREWEAFALSIWPSAGPEQLMLRDHAAEILRATAINMRTPQRAHEQSAKSKGHMEGDEGLEDVSRIHAEGRVDSGFKLVQLVAEYRALRASVIRLWRESLPHPSQEDLADLTRFNESIDESLTEAIEAFTNRLDRSRQMFLAILGHDLRNPLNSIAVSSQLLAQSKLDAEDAETVAQMNTSAQAMARMIADLLDFAGAELTGVIPIAPSPMDLGMLAHEVVNELRAAYPKAAVHLSAEGELRGNWDVDRLRQVLSNLFGNALQHGDGKVNVGVTGQEGQAHVLIKNGGAPIPPKLLPTIFDPLVRGMNSDGHRRPGSMGLGLYIVRAIVRAHGGEIDVESTQDAGTTFSIRLPCDSKAPTPQSTPTFSK